MACLVGGSIWAGSETVPDTSPVHLVTVSPFYLDRTEVSVASYLSCVEESFCEMPVPDAVDPDCNVGETRNSHPVNCVTGKQAWAYCASLGKRLPTEEEWMYAALAGVREYPWGNEPPSADRVNANEGFLADPDWGVDGYHATAPVDSMPNGATPEGVLHLAGNVWEWTQSKFCRFTEQPCVSCPHPEKCENACNDCDMSEWVVRGGSAFDAANVQAWSNFMHHRGNALSTEQRPYIGFRCAMNARAR